MSGKNNEINCELISAYLDDALGGSERRQAEQLLANDADAARYLEQLRATRDCLRSVTSSALGSSVADRVIARARAVAVSEGFSPEHHVLRGTQRPPQDCPLVTPASLDSFAQPAVPAEPAPGGRKSSDWIPRSNRVLWSALLTSAAAILCMVALPNFFLDPAAGPGGADGVAPLGGIASQNSPDSLSIGPGTSPLAEAQGADPAGDSERSPFDRIAAPAVAAAEEPAGVAGRETKVPGGVARVMGGSGSEEALRQDLEAANVGIDYLLTVDSVMAPDAWRDSYFDVLLKEVGVPMANPITADAELTKLLEESLVSVSNVTAENAGENGKAALVFIRAKGQMIDRLLFAMAEDKTRFPAVSYNLAIDPERLLLRQLLRQRAAAGEGGEGGENLGARIVRSAQESLVSTHVVPNFVPREPPKSGTQGNLGASSLNDLDGLASSANPVTDLLIILRQPPAE